jgi:prolyl oligopeptidase
VKVDVPDDANVSWHLKQMYITPRTDWKIGGKTLAGGSLLAVEFEEFMNGTSGPTVLFEPSERKSLAGFTPTKTRVIVNALDNVVNKLEMLTDQKHFWTRNGEIPGAAPMSSVNVTAVDPDETDEYFLTGSNYLNPSSLYYGTLGGKPPEKLKSGPEFFDTKGLVITQHEVASKDGTKIPYFQVSRKDMKLDGTNPTLLYGYGGFEISMLPVYNPAVGAAWLEKGGVYVVANIRGGGEFGPKWHRRRNAIAATRISRPWPRTL